MIADSSLDLLAKQIGKRCTGPEFFAGPGPYILFLGEGCARAAGAPSRADLARKALHIFKFDTSVSEEPDKVVFDKFAQYTSKLTQEQLGRMLQSLHAQIPVPLFYQYLAQLIRERYFPLIMTMSFDTLLEQALASSGVRVTDYRVTTFGKRRISSPDRSTAAADQLTHIVKLHGDLAQDILITPQQIDLALTKSQSWITADLKGDLIMVEHVVGDDPIDLWLSHSPDREIWWVSKYPPQDKRKIESWSQEPIHEITGETGDPEAFFQQLALRLLYTSDAALSDEVSDRLESVTDAYDQAQTAAPLATPPVAEPLLNDILRSQSILSSLDQENLGGERPPQVQQQIQYQKRHISHLEDQVRSLPDVKTLVTDCVQHISDQIRSRGEEILDAGTVENVLRFVDTNYNTLQSEFAKESPNQILVSAALSATLTLADRLLTEYGTSIVDPEYIKRLAALSPTAAAKVIL